MQIWVDADACPKVVKEILYRAAERVKCPLILVANQPLSTPRSAFIKTIRVSPGFDVADNYIVQNVHKGDLVITGDIPLAAEILDVGGEALNPRGEIYNRETIKQKLTMRDFMDEMRGTGIMSGGPPPLNQTDRREFANALDRFLEKVR
ncbi:Protein YaiI [hydrothermal vent metagenome]|uniref:Protein YaiI n=1 Tax=hydrothermal vent metagenome TaxID=652676 RepID=A0A3B1ACI1_9ZZZZ